MTRFQEPITRGAATLLPGVFTPMGVLDYTLDAYNLHFFKGLEA